MYFVLLFAMGLRSVGRGEGCGAAENVGGFQGKLGWCGRARLLGIFYSLLLFSSLLFLALIYFARMYVCT